MTIPDGNVMVELHEVTRVFTQGGAEIRPVDGLSLTVRRGEFVALMGPSGSGKSTLLNLLCGIDRATSGRVIVANEDLSRLSRSAMARWRNQCLGVIFQQYHLVPVLTAFENVELPLRLRKLSRADRRKRVQIALDAVGLSERSSHLPGQLSGGQQQRVAIARAFVTDPDLILADEPTGNLDRTSVSGALTLLKRLHTEFGKTLLMVTHDPSAAKVAGRTLHLDAGRIREEEVAVT